MPLDVLAPKIWSRLEEGGYWSYLGATKGAYPNLQAKANSRLLRWMFGVKEFSLDELVHSPANQQEIFDTMERHGFVVRQCETFEPELNFRNYDDFMNFAYWGGWLTPFIEAINLQHAGALTRFLLNWFTFPIKDHHSIEIHLAQKVAR